MPSEHSAEIVLRRVERGVGFTAMAAAVIGLALATADTLPKRHVLVDHQAVVVALTIKHVEPARAPATPQLLGARGDGLQMLLGGADFVRAEGAVEMRRYSGAGCTLVVFLHRGSDGLVVEHAESRAASAASAPIAVSACFDDLTQRRRIAATAMPGREAEASLSLVH